MLFITAMYGFFPSVRMTDVGTVVILTEGKDLYDTIANSETL